MGVMDFGSDDEEQTTEPDDPSVSYIYVYEQGREELEDKDNYLAEAYEYMKGGGILRQAFNSWSRYDENVHTVFSHIIVGFGRIIEEGDFSKILDFLFEPESEEEAELYGEALADWLSEHPEVLTAANQELKDRSTQDEETTKPEAPADD